nr:lytic transglycosylase domain-containing protein [Microbacterium sp.]
MAPLSRAAARARPQQPARWSRRRGVMATFAVLAVAGFAAAYVGPLAASTSSAQAAELDPVSLYATSIHDAQQYLAASGRSVVDLGRDDLTYTVSVTPKPATTSTPVLTAASGTPAPGRWSPPFVAPDPGSAQAIAYEMVAARGWSDGEFACLVALWNKESGWRVNAYNASSGAYGIPQALPGGKMASAGADWSTNPATQISWGLGYIEGRYGTPCGAWNHSQAKGWY